MASLTLIIVLPNAKRHRVVTGFNTPIMQVIEEACKTNDLKPDEYDLKYHNRVLDISSTLRFCGVPNNAQLNLVHSQKERQLNPVNITLQLESGGRLQGKFIPSDSLWDVMGAVCSDETLNKKNPVIIYMRQEVYGEKLQTTTLRMLGLTGGSALLRLLHRTREQLSVQAVATPSSSKGKGFFGKIMNKIEETISSGHDELKRKLENKPTDDKTKTENIKTVPKTSPHLEIKKNIEPVPEETSKLQKNVLEEKSQHIKTVHEHKPQLENMDTASPETEAEKYKMDCEDIQNDEVDVVVKEDKSNKNIEKMDICEDKTSNFGIKNISTTVQIDQSFIDNVKYIGERHAVVYVLDDVSATPKFEESDDFFHVTQEDAKVLLRDVKSVRNQLENAELTTAALREQKLADNMAKLLTRFPNCIVRVRFPNRFILQGIFSSSESIAEVIKFTSDFLQNSEMNFFLYISPPKRVLKSEEKLINLGIPGLLVNFGTDEGEGKKKKKKPTQYLKTDISQKKVSSDVARNVAIFFRKKTLDDEHSGSDIMPIINDYSNKSSVEPAVSSSSSSNNSQTHKPSKSDSQTDKIPKWFKKP